MWLSRCKGDTLINWISLLSELMLWLWLFPIRRLCPVEPENRVPPERNLRGPHYHHRLWKPADGQHLAPASEGVPV